MEGEVTRKMDLEGTFIPSDRFQKDLPGMEETDGKAESEEKPSSDEPVDTEEYSEEEEGDSGIEVDTDEDYEESDEYEPSDDDTEIEDEPEEDDLAKKAERAENKRRGFQRENQHLKDELKESKKREQQMLMQMNQLSQRLQQIENNSLMDDVGDDVDDDLAGLDDEEVLTVGQEKKRRALQKKQKKLQQQQSQMQTNQMAWMQSQPDYNEVVEYATRNNIQFDPYFAGARTDQIGTYFGIRSKLAQEKADKLERRIQNIDKSKKRRKSKGMVPKTGASGRVATGKGRKTRDAKLDFWTMGGKLS